MTKMLTAIERCGFAVASGVGFLGMLTLDGVQEVISTITVCASCIYAVARVCFSLYDWIRKVRKK